MQHCSHNANRQTRQLSATYLRNGLAVVLLLIANSGCISIQWRDSDGYLRSLGFVHYSEIGTGRARVFVHRTAGLNLRLTSFDGGLTLGYRKYIAVQPCDASGCIVHHSSGLFWAKDASPAEEGLYLRKAVGAELSADSLRNGFLVGYSHQAIIFGPRANESVISKIEFSEDQIEETTYTEERGS